MQWFMIVFSILSHSNVSRLWFVLRIQKALSVKPHESTILPNDSRLRQLTNCSHVPIKQLYDSWIYYVDFQTNAHRVHLEKEGHPGNPFPVNPLPLHCQLKRQTAKDKMRQDQRKHNPTLRTNGRYIILAWYSNVCSSQAACHTSFCICSAVFGRTRLSFSVILMHRQGSLDYQKVKTGDCLLILPFTVKNVTAFRKAMCRAWKVGRHAI